MAWWSWVALGFALLVAELFFPTGFYLVLFGAAALVVGIVLSVGIPLSLNLQWISFGLLALILTFTMSKRLRQWFNKKGDQRSDVVGADVVVAGAIAPGEVGNGQLWGAAWKVKNVGAAPIAAGSKCKVVEVSGVTLHIQ